ncbi:MAG: sigma-54 dependent transcriptional regulator [Desulforhopalus sp.]|nr:sigma-54 dependent transcriptional regulator [Desulforhopalus sp.]
MTKKILIIDDEAAIRESLSEILEDEGFSPLTASSGEKGLEMVDRGGIDLILLDIWLGDNMDGLETLVKIKEISPLPVIMISGHGTIDTAVDATKKGAYDFIEKPLSYDKVILSISNGLRYAKLEQENTLLRQNRKNTPGLTGQSQAIAAIRQQISMVAPTEAWVLIRGEHGTGKELVAQAIHRESATASQPMVEVNCAAIPEELIESELFGHEKGSFTGATASKRGKFDMADEGILFLDEIGDMSLVTQAKILRILQEQKFERVGGNKTISVNVRVLAATNKNLEQEIKTGNFRADLFYRLNVVPITLPPLRKRLEDIPLLVESLMKELTRKGLNPKTFSAAALTEMMAHPWPGNVRELRNFIERLIIMCPEEKISAEQIQLFLGPGTTPSVTEPGIPPASNLSSLMLEDYKVAKQLFEQEYLQQKLLENDGNVTKTAEAVGLERSHLHKKLKAMGVI